jgi:hypothetical protein
MAVTIPPVDTSFLDDECRHGISVATCALCRPKPVVSKPSGFQKGAGIEASFEGTCPKCRGDILVGDRIMSVDPEGYGYEGSLPDRLWIHCVCPT